MKHRPHVLLFDTPESRLNMMPLTLTRPVGALRVGIDTIAEKWERRFDVATSWLTADYLQPLFPSAAGDNVYLVDGRLIPDAALWQAITALDLGQKLVQGYEVLAARTMLLPDHLAQIHPLVIDMETKTYEGAVKMIRRPYDLFLLNGEEVEADFGYLPLEGNVGVQDAFTKVYAPEKVYVAAGAQVKACILNAEAGPIYIGPDAEVQEGSMIRGPFALGAHSVVNMGAKIRQGTTIGPFCKVGGEISNSILLGYSNKGHDGFLGNSVLGEWCNLGADTNTSNLKNTYSSVRVYNYASDSAEDSGQTFVGLIMGDHSKAGINTMFNTGTVVGVAANIFGAGFPEKFIPSFSWGGPDNGSEQYTLPEMLKTAKRVMERRQVPLHDRYQKMLEYLHSVEDLSQLI